MAEYCVSRTSNQWSLGGIPLRLYPHLRVLWCRSHPVSSIQMSTEPSQREISITNLALSSSLCCTAICWITCRVQSINFKILQIVATLNSDFKHHPVLSLELVQVDPGPGFSKLALITTSCLKSPRSLGGPCYCAMSLHENGWCLPGQWKHEQWEVEDFIRTTLLPILRPFNWINSNSVVIMDYASIRHVEGVTDLMKNQAGAKFSSSGLSRSQSLWRHL